MSVTRQTEVGATRTCPHCRAEILESAAQCPVCRGYLRFAPGGAEQSAPSFSPLTVEGAIRHPSTGGPWEYSVMVSVRNEKGEEIARHAVGVGALQPGEKRTFTLSVDVFKTGGGSSR